MRIYLSPSGQTHNAYAYGNYTEAQICRRIAQRCEDYLKQAGHTVKVADPYTTDEQWKARCTESDNMNADYHIPIHTNAGGGHGVRIFGYSAANLNDPVLNRIYNNLYKLLPTQFKKGSKTINRNLYEVNVPKAITVYVEAAFHDNVEEAKWIVDNVDAIGKAIAEGIHGSAIGNNTGKLYRVQVGAYANKANAEKQLANLKAHGFSGVIKEG